jgi:hypothetical protein
MKPFSHWREIRSADEALSDSAKHMALNNDDSHLSDSDLERIITTRKKIREMTHDLRNWMGQGPSDKTHRMQTLFYFTFRQLDKQLSSESAFTLFCACADSIARATPQSIQEDDWDGVLKQLLHIMKAQSAVIPLDKYKVTLLKV